MIKYIENTYPDYKNYDLIPKSYKIKSDFEKVAYEMADPVKAFIETLKPSKDSNYYWINAMGSGELYGANNRGDYFPRQELMDHHHTFVDTPAKVYIQHRNKDPQMSLGDVLFSHFNPDTERVELVQRIDWNKVFKSYTPDWIRTLLQTDKSFNTSMGCFSKETKIKTIDGWKYIDQIKVNDFVLTHTGQYKKVKNLFSKLYEKGIFTIKSLGNGDPFKVTFEHPFLIAKKENVKNKYNSFIVDNSLELEWVKTQDLKKGDYIAYGFSETIENDKNTSKDLARLLGYYLSDGYYYSKGKERKNSHLEFCFGKHELSYFEDIKNITKSLINYDVKIKQYDNFIRVYIYNKKFADFVYELTQKEKKILSPEILKWSPEIQLEILGSFINGDGFEYNGNIFIENSNEELIDQLNQIACRNGIIWSLTKLKHIANKNSVCRFGLESIGYQVRYGKNYNKILSNVTDKVKYIPSKKCGDRKFFFKNYLFSEITKIDFDSSWVGQIYNFEVENDNTYIANNIVVHNCRVGYDQCSYCGQRNKTVADYCEHLKNHMNQWVDGIKVYAINIDPKFFDNSIVARGADRTARSIKKVASFDSDTIMHDSELDTQKKYFFFEDKPQPFITESTVEKIASNSRSLELQELQDLCKYELADILGTTKVAGCDLLPHEFQYVVLNKLGFKKEADDHWSKQERFEIPSRYHTPQPIKLAFSQDVFKDIESFVADKSLYAPFLVKKALTKEAAGYNYFLKSSPLLDIVGQSYIEYQLEKMAGIDDVLAQIMPKLLLMFLTNLGPWKSMQTAKDNASDMHTRVMSSVRENTTKVPIVTRPQAGVYNPVVYRDNMMFNKQASIETWALKKGIKPTLKYGPALAVSAATTGMLVGKNKEDETTGEEPSAISTFARKHPIASTLGVAGLTRHAYNKIKKKFKKTASDEFLESYKNYLNSLDADEFLNAVNSIPNELFTELVL